jgi:hypothetical protein
LKNEPLSNFYQFYLMGVQPSKMENSLWRHNKIYSLWHHKDEFPILDTKNFQEPPNLQNNLRFQKLRFYTPDHSRFFPSKNYRQKSGEIGSRFFPRIPDRQLTFPIFPEFPRRSN